MIVRRVDSHEIEGSGRSEKREFAHRYLPEDFLLNTAEEARQAGHPIAASAVLHRLHDQRLAQEAEEAGRKADPSATKKHLATIEREREKLRT